MSLENGGLTELLQAWQRGDSEADAELFTKAYVELKRQAARYMRRERPNHTLQATAIVNEAWIALQAESKIRFENTNHFLAVAALIMRHILVAYARRATAEKRGGGLPNLSLHDDLEDKKNGTALDILALNEALIEFSEIEPKKSKAVALKYFGGVSTEKVAEILGRSPTSVKRDLFVARAWLYERLR